MLELRQLSPDDWPQWREVRVRALGEAPAAFSSTLAEWQNEGDTEARWRDRLCRVPFNLIARLSGRPVGQVSATAVDDRGRVELISMWVAPEARGRGVGDALVGAVVRWAEGQSAEWVVLSVKCANDRANALYERNGFAPTMSPADEGEREMARRVRPKVGA